MMECKKALQDSEVNGDIGKAMDWLRAKGIAKATSENSRVAAEGLIAVFQNSGKVTLVEVNSETDFVSRNSSFQKFVSLVASTANSLDYGEIPLDEVMALSTPQQGSNGKALTLQDILGDITTSIRENIIVRRVTNINAAGSDTIAASYIHGKVTLSDEGHQGLEMGREAAVVCLKGSALEGGAEVLTQAARRLAMHVVAAKPTYLRAEDVPEDVLFSERAIYIEQTIASPPKNPAMFEKIVEGKVNKRLAEMSLLGQNHMAAEGTPVVAKYLKSLESETGCNDLAISGYWRWSLGQLATPK
ncbi:tsf [Symbiodinium microadriaticum]|nr:tsf [Symbiodinium microadriaticum]